MEVWEEIWPRAKEYDIGPFWSFCRGIIVYGIADEIFCFDKDNKIVLLDYYTTGEATPVEGDFSDCLMKQIEELEDRKNRKIRGEDKR